MSFIDAIRDELRENELKQTIHLSIDKIGLRIESHYLNKEQAKRYQTGILTILFFGNTAQINIHAEFRIHVWEHYKKITNFVLECYDAIDLLRNDGVFSEKFEQIYDRVHETFYDEDNEIGYKYCLLDALFTLVELEIAFDFFDIPVFIKPNKKEHTNFRVCRGTTFYTLDWRQPRRKIDGKMISKGRQQSFICIYDKSKKFKAEKNIHGYKQKMTRFEMRYQGKYKRYLSMDILIGNEEFILYRLLKSAKKILKKLITPENIELYWYWLDDFLRVKFLLLSEYLEYLLLNNDEVNPSRYDYTQEEELVDAIISYSRNTICPDINDSIHDIDNANELDELDIEDEDFGDIEARAQNTMQTPFNMLYRIRRNSPNLSKRLQWETPFNTDICVLDGKDLTDDEALDRRYYQTPFNKPRNYKCLPLEAFQTPFNTYYEDMTGNSVWDEIDLTGDNPL